MKFQELFNIAADKLWNCCEAPTKASFSQRVRRLREWTKAAEVPDVIMKPIEKLKNNISGYSKAYDLPGCHRTSNMADRPMQRMDRHLLSTFYFHGSLASAELGIRGWALIHKFAPCNPTTVKRHDGLRCPAEWLNKSRYHENWLQNLLASATMGDLGTLPQIRYRIGLKVLRFHISKHFRTTKMHCARSWFDPRQVESLSFGKHERAFVRIFRTR